MPPTPIVSISSYSSSRSPGRGSRAMTGGTAPRPLPEPLRRTVGELSESRPGVDDAGHEPVASPPGTALFSSGPCIKVLPAQRQRSWDLGGQRGRDARSEGRRGEVHRGKREVPG